MVRRQYNNVREEFLIIVLIAKKLIIRCIEYMLYAYVHTAVKRNIMCNTLNVYVSRDIDAMTDIHFGTAVARDAYVAHYIYICTVHKL